MHIGTPLSPTATRVMVLGSGELGKEVIVALQRLGVETIAVDRYANAPGHQVAHRAHVIAMTDGPALRRLIEQERPHIIVPEIEAIATDVLVEVEKAGLAEVVPTARAAQLTMNREGIRRLAAETLGMPTSPYRFADSRDALEAAIADGIGYPCVVKPVMSSSGKGQSYVEGPEGIAAAWDYAKVFTPASFSMTKNAVLVSRRLGELFGYLERSQASLSLPPGRSVLSPYLNPRDGVMVLHVQPAQSSVAERLIDARSGQPWAGDLTAVLRDFSHLGTEAMADVATGNAADLALLRALGCTRSHIVCTSVQDADVLWLVAVTTVPPLTANWALPSRLLKVAPAEVSWDDGEQRGLWAGANGGGLALADNVGSSAARVPAEFLALAELAGYHRDPGRWGLLYRVLYRLTHGEAELLQRDLEPHIPGLLKPIDRDLLVALGHRLMVLDSVLEKAIVDQVDALHRIRAACHQQELRAREQALFRQGLEPLFPLGPDLAIGPRVDSLMPQHGQQLESDRVGLQVALGHGDIQLDVSLIALPAACLAAFRGRWLLVVANLARMMNQRPQLGTAGQ